MGCGLWALGVAAALLGACANDSDSESPKDAGAEARARVILDGGGGLPPPPTDSAAACGAGVCNYQTQVGCSSGETCGPVLADGSVVPGCQSAGTAQEGASCSGWSDCARGLFCAAGVCRRFCCGNDWSVCPAAQSCYRPLFIRDPATDAGLPVNAELCFPVGDCDIFDEQSCAGQPGTVCQIVDPLGHVACGPEGKKQLGEDCSKSEPCAHELRCVDKESGAKCGRLCRAVEGGGEPCSPSTEVCVHYDRDPKGVGECVEQ